MSVTVKIDNSNLRDRLGLFDHLNYEHLVAGVSGGVVSTLVLQPLDVIKIRFAVNDGRLNSVPRYTGITNAFTTIFKQEGVRGLYRGVTPNLWGAGSAWGLYFLFYNALKSKRGETDTPPGHLWTMAASGQAGALTLCFTNPLWVVKTRLCLQYGGAAGSGDKYKGMVDALVKIYQTEGIKGYYKGMVPGLFGVSHGAVQFMVYEGLKNAYHNRYNLSEKDKLSPEVYLSMAALSKLVAAATTYPYQVVRLRLQNQHYQYKGLLDCIGRTWTFEGWRGFYKGLGTNLVRVTPATMITFLTYENVSHFLKEQKQKQSTS